MKDPWLGGLCALGLLLATSPAAAECADVYGCVCGAHDLVAVATVLEVRTDGYARVRIDRIEGSVPGHSEAWSVGEEVEALPSMQVLEGARAYLSNSGPGSTDLLVQFNQAQPSGEIECSGVQFGEEEFIETALAADCIDRARARGIDNRCVDEVSCSLSGAPAGTSAPANAAWWLAGLALALLGRRRR